MNKNKVTEEITLHEILGEFLDSYADRDLSLIHI